MATYVFDEHSAWTVYVEENAPNPRFLTEGFFFYWIGSNTAR